MKGWVSGRGLISGRFALFNAALVLVVTVVCWLLTHEHLRLRIKSEMLSAIVQTVETSRVEVLMRWSVGRAARGAQTRVAARNVVEHWKEFWQGTVHENIDREDFAVQKQHEWLVYFVKRIGTSPILSFPMEQFTHHLESWDTWNCYRSVVDTARRREGSLAAFRKGSARRPHVTCSVAPEASPGKIAQPTLGFVRCEAPTSFGCAFLHSTILPLISWKWISQTLSATSSLSNVTNPKPARSFCFFWT